MIIHNVEWLFTHLHCVESKVGNSDHVDLGESELNAKIVLEERQRRRRQLERKAVDERRLMKILVRKFKILLCHVLVFWSCVHLDVGQ